MGRRAERGAGGRNPRLPDRSRVERLRGAATEQRERELKLVSDTIFQRMGVRHDFRARSLRTGARRMRTSTKNTSTPASEKSARTGIAVMRRAALSAALALGAVPALSQTTHPGIRIGDTEVFPESVTSTSDGTVYAGSVKGNVYRASPGESVALPWIRTSDENGILTILGVFADEARGTLWLCSVPNFFGPERSEGVSSLMAFDLESGEQKAV